MSANDYYNQSSRPEQTTQPYYQSYNPPQHPPLDPAPSYHSQPPSRAPSARPQETSPVSPFEAPFDDHVYPVGRPAPHGFDSQSTLDQDSRYYGQGGGGRPQDSTNSFRDDIPLRDNPGVPPKDHYNDSVDHVYDAGDPNAPAHLEEARPQRRSGMDFIKKSKWSRIAWVCYILATIQTAVFIAEIAKNGMSYFHAEMILTNNSQHNSQARRSKSIHNSTQ